MKYSLTATALLAATVSADLCAHGSTDDNGNWYCQEVKAITYTGVGSSNSYNKVTSMNSGGCGSSPQAYSGSLAPLDEEVSMHFRGPLKLKQFAFYAPSNDTATSYKEKREIERRMSAHARRHAHGHAHAHKHEERAVGDMVYATINGQVQSWVNEYTGQSPQTSSSSAPAAAATPASYDNSNSGSGSGLLGNLLGGSGSGSGSGSSSASASASSGSSGSSGSSSPASDGASGGTGWTRQGYYNAESQQADGVVFLNHQGGGGSGTFDYTYGNSLSYSSTNGKSCASSPQTLADTELGSSDEVVIMSDSKCSGDSCGFYRDGTVAYHGFDGPSKAFFFEFEMPDSGETAASKYDPVNMPAIWLLNAQIPRTLQYGKSECSCWESGCGEFDIFEVLAPGDARCKSTLHSNVAGGDSDYFARPTNGTMKAALLLYNDNIHIKVLDDSTEFGATMGNTFVDDICQDTLIDSLSNLVSLFKLGS